MRQWIALLAMIAAAEQVRTAECRVACGYLGYDSGGYWKNQCYCVDFKDYSDITNRHPIYLPKKSKNSKALSNYVEAPAETQRGYPKELDDYLF